MSQQEYLGIRVSTLRGDLKIPFDVYVRVAGKYIHYCRAGDSFEGARLARLRGKKLQKLFVRSEDQSPYEQYLEENVNSAFDLKSQKSITMRAEIIQGFEQAAIEQFLEEPLNEQTYHHVSSSAERLTQILGKLPELSAALVQIDNPDLSISQHSVNVATFTLGMAARSEFRDSPKLHLLALGCLLHDIDHHTSGIDLSRPPTSKEEKADYRLHPTRGAGLMQGATFVDQLVTTVITQHEELVNGTGFPKGLIEKQIEPIVLLACVANAYDRLVSFQRLTPKEAMKTLLIDRLGLLPLEHLKNLNYLLKDYGML